MSGVYFARHDQLAAYVGGLQNNEA
jgi:hypothetical protein